MKTKKLNLREFRYYPVLFLVGVVLFFSINFGWLNPFISLIQNLTLPIQIGFHQISSGIADFAGTTFQIGGLRAKNSDLTLENSTLKAENAKLKLLETENKSLKEQIGTIEKTKFQIKLSATVIGTGGFGTKKVLLLDKGSNDKVTKNDLVVVKDILIGKVIDVSPKVSSVQLLSDPDTSIPVVTQSGAEGILEGKFGSEVLLTNVLQSEELSEKEIVFTSGKGEFPRNLVVGEIAKVNKIEKEFFQTATISELIDLREITLVYLLRD